MAWDHGAIEFQPVVIEPPPVVTPPPATQADSVYIVLKPGQRQQNVKVNYRKGKTSRDVIVTVNAGTVVKVDIV